MKLSRRSRSSGAPKGRLRLVLLAATVAAFLLVPAAQALAVEPGFTTVEIAGSGSGEVSSVGSTLIEPMEGTPPIQCHYTSPGPATGECIAESTFEPELSVEGVILRAVPAPGSEFGGWEIVGVGHQFYYVSGEGVCRKAPGNAQTAEEESVSGSAFPSEAYEGGSVPCLAESGENPEEFGGEVTVKVLFNKAFPLNLTTSGGGSGSFECEIVGTGNKTSCASEYGEGEQVAITPVAGGSSTFVEFNNENGGECSGATCTVTMSAAKTVNAAFNSTGPPAPTVTGLSPNNGPEAGGNTVTVAGTNLKTPKKSTSAPPRSPARARPASATPPAQSKSKPQRAPAPSRSGRNPRRHLGSQPPMTNTPTTLRSRRPPSPASAPTTGPKPAATR